jgi:hypothetical protein
VTQRMSVGEGKKQFNRLDGKKDGMIMGRIRVRIVPVQLCFLSLCYGYSEIFLEMK